MSKNSFEQFRDNHHTTYTAMAKRAGVGTSYFRDLRNRRIKHNRGNSTNRMLLQYVLTANDATPAETANIMWEYGYVPDNLPPLDLILRIIAIIDVTDLPTEIRRLIKTGAIYNQVWWSDESGVDRGYISRIMHGQVIPTRDAMNRLASTLYDPIDKARLLWAAGYVPQELTAISFASNTFSV